MEQYIEKRNGKKIGLAVGMVILVLLLVGVLVLYFQGNVGRAIFVGETPFLGEVNLIQEQDVTFTALPADARQNRTAGIRLALYPFACDGDTSCNGRESILSCPSVCTDPNTHHSGIYPYNIEIWRPEQNILRFIIRDNQPNRDPVIIAQDQFIVGQDDDINIHLLDDERGLDDTADLRVTYENNQITFRNLHYRSDAEAVVEVLNVDDSPVSPLMQINPGDTFTRGIRASTQVAAPTITADIRRVDQATGTNALDGTPTTDANQKRTEGQISWTAPQISGAYVLRVTASVPGVGTPTVKEYTLAVGNVLYYAPQQNRYPELYVRNYSNTPAGREQVEFNISLTGSRTLQPLGLPCQPADTQVITTFNEYANIQRFFSYDARAQSKVTRIRGGPSQIDNWELFKGYYVKLQNAVPTNISFVCNTIRTYEPTGATPRPGEQTYTLHPGWNFISIPGVIPHSLGEYVRSGNYLVYDCPIGNNCADTPMAANALLYPGRAYMVYAEDGLVLRYLER